MRYLRLGTMAVTFFLWAASLRGQDVVVKLLPFNGTAATYVNMQIRADTVTAGGLSANRVYEFQRDKIYLHNAIFTVPNRKTLRLRAEAGTGKKPVIFLWETGTGGDPDKSARKLCGVKRRYFGNEKHLCCRFL